MEAVSQLSSLETLERDTNTSKAKEDDSRLLATEQLTDP